ncbi:DNA-binding HxlR family transcriptional regulator [Rheinheimera pacifica]|uniref:winged helix-turn-helix transcriptional regulator n=1 Tax=Rheinheimera pacifica TaxID=173990 RepID=UPI000CC89B25|nr:helix-turn-helix domain-containing protein [Rheinheimera pacifica]MDR6982266.1 DNA-binding HxlR family transcriptional regulator [Rheinheimera pacifica]PKM17875.1 MAG: transcriptional regulator [Gammaproteobacteria bacterium HGW-Gammaproteobacteria-15]
MRPPLSRDYDPLSNYQKKLGSLHENCPVQAALDIVRGRWKPSILYALKQSSLRYSELQRALPRISPQALSTQLKQLEADGLVAREVYAEVPVRVEYRLSEFGTTLFELINSLDDWGTSYLAHRKSHL